jgi:hypothetical protein
MPKYIIHIGPPKSGTSYIQSQLFHLREYLEEKGVLYPWTRPGTITHHIVREALTAGRDLKADFDEINAKGAEIIILSCAAFDGLQIAMLQRLKEYIDGNPVDIVYYARRWSERIPSDWRERVKMGHYATFPEFYIRLVSRPESTGEVNYSIVWDRFAKVFGRDSLRIVSFNNLVEGNVDLFKHFMETIVGLHDMPKVKKGLIQKNERLDTVDTEILRALNCLQYAETAEINPSERIKFDRLTKRYDLQPLRDHVKSDVRQIKLKDTAAPLRPTWEAISAYKDRLVSPEYGKEIFEQRDVETEFVGQNYLFREGAVGEVKKLYLFIKSGSMDGLELQALL